MSATLTYPEAIILGAFQGVTELFPVSSLGHSVLIPALVGGSWKADLNVTGSQSPYLAFIVGMHVATAIAMIIYFWRDWLRIIKGFFGSFGQITSPAPGTGRFQFGDTYARLAWMIVLATIPVGLAGLILDHPVRTVLAKPTPTAVFLTLNGLLLFGGEIMRRRRASLDAQQVLVGQGSAGPGSAGPGSARQGSAGQGNRARQGWDAERAYQDQSRLGERGYDDRGGYGDQAGYSPRGYDDRDRYAGQGYGDRGDYRGQADYGDRGGYDRVGYHDQRDYEQRSYDQRGYDQRDYEQRGYDQRGYDQRGYDQQGYDQRGYEQGNYDPRHYRQDGPPAPSFHPRDPREYDPRDYGQDGRRPGRHAPDQNPPEQYPPQQYPPRRQPPQQQQAGEYQPVPRRSAREQETEAGVQADSRLVRLSWLSAIALGASQILALFPGFSRDGSVMVSGMARGLSRQDAVRFSFLLSAPVILAAGVFKAGELVGPETKGIHGPILAGMLVAGVCAYLALWFLDRLLSNPKRTLTPFAIYCLIAGIISLLVVA